MKPVNLSHRIDILDVLRGAAIFGIFVVNVEIMNCLFINGDSFGAQWTSALDQISVRIKQLFFYSKFFPIFSLLFGVGISIQLASMKRQGNGKAFFLRRMFALFLFGVGHIIFLWSGDVIHLYALLGIFTLVITNWKSIYLLIFAILLLVFPYYNEVSSFLTTILDIHPEQYLSTYSPDDIRSVIRSGDYLSGVDLHMREYGSNIMLLYTFLMPVALSMFLLGLVIGKKGYLRNITHYINYIKKPVIIIALITNSYRIIFLFFTWDTALWKEPLYRDILIYLMQLCDVVMSLFIVWIIAYLYQFTTFNKLLNPLRYVGRMALTNYIMQSVIGLIIFSSIGLGLYETLSPFETLLLAIGVFAFQIFLSRLWLKYYLFGPLEWFWRCISYWKFIPIRINTL